MIGEGSPTVGVVGGGQLGRMLAEAAAPLGIDVIVADPTPDPPAAPVARDALVGDFDDQDTLRSLAARADYLTYEIELADPDRLAAVSAESGVPVHPSPDTLRMTGDKLTEKQRLAADGIPVPDFRPIDNATQLEAALDALGRPLMLKARAGGYDGRGNAPVASVEAARDRFGNLDGLVAERMIDFDREVSVIGVVGEDSTTTFPVVENVHETEILRETIAPTRSSLRVTDRATTVAETVLSVLDGRGVFGIELFEASGDILVNEIAPRPHNSGHYSIEGAHTSQFEQHLRAVVGWPLGSPELRDPVVMANILGDVEEPRPARLSGVPRVLETAGAHLHWYGKREARPLRKMGHVTVVPTEDDSRDTLLSRARTLRDHLTFT